MRKILALTMVALLSLTIALAVIGCQKKDESSTTTPPETMTPPETTSAMPDTAMHPDTSMHK